MKSKIWGIAVLVLCLVCASPLLAADGELFLITTDQNGNNHFMNHTGNGILSAPQSMAGADWYPYGNALADFDNDGDYDYLVASGFFGGSINLFEKLGDANNFAPPVSVASWNNGAFFATNLVVADFDEDGNLDFIQVYDYSSDCELFLGNGALGFSGPVALTATAPFSSYAADAADFNNDGHADFIVAPADHSGQFFVNLGLGDGSFETRILNTYNASAYMGVAAADFNEDGAMDLAATTSGGIDIYWGDPQADWTDGNVHLGYGYRLSDSNIGDSPLDNYDFNDDGHQDLVVAGYGASGNQIAIFRGNGSGNFELLHLNTAGSRSIAMTAPPTPLAAEIVNQDPVAVIEPGELSVTAGVTAAFYATGSYDPDGEIEIYQWNFGDGLIIEDVAPSHVFYEAGDYTVTLTVTDTLGASNTATAVVHVTPVAASVVFYPRTLNLKSRGRWILARVRLADGYDTRGIDRTTLAIVDPETGQTVATGVKARCLRRLRMLLVKFDRQAVINHIGEPNPQAVLHVVGKVTHNGGLADFAGSGTVRAIKPEKKNKKLHRKLKKIRKRLAKKARRLRRHKRH